MTVLFLPEQRFLKDFSSAAAHCPSTHGCAKSNQRNRQTNSDHNRTCGGPCVGKTFEECNFSPIGGQDAIVTDRSQCNNTAFVVKIEPHHIEVGDLRARYISINSRLDDDRL